MESDLSTWLTCSVSRGTAFLLVTSSMSSTYLSHSLERQSIGAVAMASCSSAKYSLLLVTQDSPLLYRIAGYIFSSGCKVGGREHKFKKFNDIFTF